MDIRSQCCFWFHIAFLVVLHLASAAQYLMLLRVESFALLRDVVYWLHELAWLLCNAVLYSFKLTIDHPSSLFRPELQIYSSSINVFVANDCNIICC